MIDIKQMIGKNLNGVIASVYFEDIHQKEIFMEDIMDICLVIDDISITISCNEDGETLDINKGNLLQEIDMREHGVIKIKDVADFLGLKQISHINDIQTIVNEKFIQTGLTLSIDKGRIIIQNKGDQIMINFEHGSS